MHLTLCGPCLQLWYDQISEVCFPTGRVTAYPSFQTEQHLTECTHIAVFNGINTLKVNISVQDSPNSYAQELPSEKLMSDRRRIDQPVLTGMKTTAGNRQVDVTGRDSHRFRVRSCPRAVTDIQEAEALVSSAVRSNWRGLRLSSAPVRRQRRQRRENEENRKNVSERSSSDEKVQSSSRDRGRIIDRVTLVEPVGDDDDETPPVLSIAEDSSRSSFRPARTTFRDNKFRIRGLSPSEETLIMLNRQDRHLVREAWKATLPAVDTSMEDYERRARLAVEFEKDKWNLRMKEIEAINRARYLNEERDRNRRSALLAVLHKSWLEQRNQARAMEIKPRIQLLRRDQTRAMRKLREELEGVEKRRLKKDPVQFLVDPSSDGFAPQARFGEHARRWHEYLPNRGKLFQDAKAMKEIEDCVVNHWAPSKFDLAAANKQESPELCVYLTKWTPAKLKDLHADLKEIRKHSNRMRCKFRPREWTLQSEKPEFTDESRFRPPQEEKMLHSVLTLQKLLRGRAVQAIMYKGRRHNRELIKEILSSKPFDTGEDEPDVAAQGLNASTGWPRLKTFNEYSVRPLQEKWVQQALGNLPPTLPVRNLEDFVNLNLMKMRGRHQDKSAENTETVLTTALASDTTSKTTFDAAYISCGVSRSGKKYGMTPRRRPITERRTFPEESDIGRFTARVRSRQSRQGSQITTHPEETAEPPYPAVPTSQEIAIRVGRVDTQTVHEIPTIVQSVCIPTAISTSACFTTRPSTTDSSLQDLRGNLSHRSTVEIHGRSSSHVGFRSGPWICRSPPTECPGTPASEDTVTAISRFTGDDFMEHRLDEDDHRGQRPSAGFNVSASASEDTPSTDDTHIIADDATEQFAAAFRAKVREQGNTLAAQRIDEAPSPTESGQSSTLVLPMLNRSVSQHQHQHRASADIASSVSEEHARRMIAQTTNSTTSITTDTSESSWTLNEARQIRINQYMREKKRNRLQQGKGAISGTKMAGGEKAEPTVECNEKED